MTARSFALALVALPVLACASAPKETLDEVSSDVRIESLPLKAHVSVAGHDLGPTPATLHVEPGQTYAITLTAVGFQARSFGGTTEDLLKNRTVELVLVPPGFQGPPPAGNDPGGLTRVAEILEKRKEWARAAEFWRRVIVLSPHGPRAHKGLGSALAKLGQDEAAIREYSQYLFLDPQAEDAERVQKAIDSYRGGIVVKSHIGDDEP